MREKTSEDVILQRTRDFVREQLEKDSSGHDWWHIYRVTELAKTIAQEEGAHIFICEMAALLHDIPDDKLNKNPEDALLKVVTWLKDMNVDEETTQHIIEIITTISFKGGNRPPVRTLEAQVVQDADRLDALGAIGIARTFAYAGAKGSLMYDPNLAARTEMTYEEYRTGTSTAINHFYEKLLKLKDYMNTEFGRQLAEERHQYMESFLKQFYAEWNGER